MKNLSLTGTTAQILSRYLQDKSGITAAPYFMVPPEMKQSEWNTNWSHSSNAEIKNA